MFHKEGYQIIMTSFVLAAAIAVGAEYQLEGQTILKFGLQLFALVGLILVLQFFRNPKRETPININHLIAPVDGKVVIIQEVYEKEYFKDQRLQVSIFMSPLNVHVTRYAMSGTVQFSKYHPGKYLVAWHPKSSELNERTTIVLKNEVFGEILYRQIAGTVARRIVNYAKVGDEVTQGEDAGFIKFGSRVDLFLPLGTPLEIALNETVKGGVQTIAHKSYSANKLFSSKAIFSLASATFFCSIATTFSGAFATKRSLDNFFSTEAKNPFMYCSSSSIFLRSVSGSSEVVEGIKNSMALTLKLPPDSSLAGSLKWIFSITPNFFMLASKDKSLAPFVT